MYMYIHASTNFLIFFHVCTGSCVANEVYELVTTLTVLRLLSLNFPHMFQLDFPPKAAILSLLMKHKTSVENAVELVGQQAQWPLLIFVRPS